MKYKLEAGLSRIVSPIVFVFPDGTRKKYKSGTELSPIDFDEKYKVVTLKAINGEIEAVLEKTEVLNASWYRR